MDITKAVIPAAGRGTRMLKVSETIPKEMLPVGRHCMIDYAIKEAAESGIKDILVIISKTKNMLRDYLLEKLSKSWREKAYTGVSLHFVYQDEPRGVGDAYLHARDFAGKEPFAVIVPDNIIASKRPVTKQLIDVFKRYNKDLMGVMKVSKKSAGVFWNCGRIEFNTLEENVLEITKLHDKDSGTFPVERNKEVLRGIARYVSTEKFFIAIEETHQVNNGELDDVPAFQEMIQNLDVLGVVIEGEVFDAGHPAGYYKAHEYMQKRKG